MGGRDDNDALDATSLHWLRISDTFSFQLWISPAALSRCACRRASSFGSIARAPSSEPLELVCRRKTPVCGLGLTGGLRSVEKKSKSAQHTRKAGPQL